MPTSTPAVASLSARDQQLLIWRRPWLVMLLLCRTPLHVVVFNTLPIALVCGWLARSAHLGTASILTAVGTGLVYWSLFEYAVHRWLYHTVFRRGFMRDLLESLHLYHHRNLPDPRVLNAGPLLAHPLIATLLLPVYLVSGLDAAWTGVVGLALVSYYTFYEFVHYGIHYRVFGSGYMRFIQRYHLFHHEAAHWDSNFGNTHPLWDLISGSYDRAWRAYEVSAEMERTLVTANPAPAAEAAGGASDGDSSTR